MNSNDDQINYKELLFQLMHELRNINHIIKSSSEIISRAVSGNKIDKLTLQEHTSQIFDNAYLISLWLDIIDFEVNPELFTTQRLESRSLWGKFKKSIISFKRIAKNKKIKIEIAGESKTSIELYPIIDILPYILLDNAVKYSPSYSTVEIEFSENESSIDIQIISSGPMLKKEEMDKLFTKGFRSKNAIKLGVIGSGRGLSIVKYICDIHDASIEIKTGDNAFEFEHIDYSEFSVYLRFPKLRV